MTRPTPTKEEIAAVRIQRFVRGNIALNRLAKSDDSVLTAEQKARLVVIREHERERKAERKENLGKAPPPPAGPSGAYLEKHEQAATDIQKWYRAIKAKQERERLKAEKKSKEMPVTEPSETAATLLQAVWRGRAARKEFAEKLKAAREAEALRLAAEKEAERLRKEEAERLREEEERLRDLGDGEEEGDGAEEELEEDGDGEEEDLPATPKSEDEDVEEEEEPEPLEKEIRDRLAKKDDEVWPRIFYYDEYKSKELDSDIKDYPEDRGVTSIRGFSTDQVKGRSTDSFDFLQQAQSGLVTAIYKDSVCEGIAWDRLQGDVNSALAQCGSLKDDEVRTSFVQIATKYNEFDIEKDGDKETPIVSSKTFNSVGCLVIQTKKGVTQIFTDNNNDIGVRMLHDKEQKYFGKNKDGTEIASAVANREKLYARAYELCKDKFPELEGDADTPEARKARDAAIDSEIKRVARALIRKEADQELEAKIERATILSKENGLSENEYAEILTHDKGGALRASRDLLKEVDAPISLVPGIAISKSARDKNVVKVAFTPSDKGTQGNDLPYDEIYLYIEGSPQCYVRVAVAKQAGEMPYWNERGERVTKKDCKIGEIVIDQCISHFVGSGKSQVKGGYNKVPVYGQFYGYDSKFEKTFSGQTTAIERLYRKMVIEAVSTVGDQRAVAIKTNAKPGKGLTHHSTPLPQVIVIGDDNKTISFTKKGKELIWDPEEVFVKHPYAPADRKDISIKLRVATYTGYHKLNDGSVKYFEEGKVFAEPLPFRNTTTDPKKPAKYSKIEAEELEGSAWGPKILKSTANFKIAAKVVDEIKDAEEKLRNAAQRGEIKAVKEVLELRGKIQEVIDKKVLKLEGERDAGGVTLEKQAEYNAQIDALKKSNIDINSTNSFGRTALVLAIQGKHGKFIKGKPAVLKADGSVKTAATDDKVGGVIGLLLEEGADVSKGIKANRNLDLFENLPYYSSNKWSRFWHGGSKDPKIGREYREAKPEHMMQNWDGSKKILDDGKAIGEEIKKRSAADEEDKYKETVDRLKAASAQMKQRAKEMQDLSSNILKVSPTWRKLHPAFASKEEVAADAARSATGVPRLVGKSSLDKRLSKLESYHARKEEESKPTDGILHDIGNLKVGEAYSKIKRIVNKAVRKDVDLAITRNEAKAEELIARKEAKFQKAAEELSKREDPTKSPSEPKAERLKAIREHFRGKADKDSAEKGGGAAR